MHDLDDVVGLHLRKPILLIQAGLIGLTRTLGSRQSEFSRHYNYFRRPS